MILSEKDVTEPEEKKDAEKDAEKEVEKEVEREVEKEVEVVEKAVVEVNHRIVSQSPIFADYYSLFRVLDISKSKHNLE